ncbi:DNA polymerase [Brevibacillus sp. 7WMA2]|uniref:DNA polymerase n=1 Tax=Brevibacillus sp. 7WMA2 TaxID=2683193 RepID=UPI00353007FB
MADATKRKSAAKETIEQAWARVGAQKLTDKERVIYETAKTAFFSGAIGRLSEKKLSKAEVLEMGRRIMAAQATEAREERIAETLRNKPTNYHVITNDGQLARMMDRLREEVRLQQADEWFRKAFGLFNDTHIRRKLLSYGIELPLVQSFTAWDTETSGLDKMIDLTGGYSFWLPLLDEGYYVAYGHLTGEDQCTRSKALDAVRAFMEDAGHVKSFHNAEFDLAMLLNDGFRPRGIRYDSKDAQFILNDHEESYALKPLLTKYKKYITSRYHVVFDDYTFEDLFGSTSPMKYPIEVVGIYAIKDVHKGWYLTRWQIEMMLASDNLHVPYFQIRQFLPEVNVTIERTGFQVNLVKLSGLGDEFRPKFEAAEKAIFDTYKIDDAFLYDMSMALRGDKISSWCKAQQERIQKRHEMLQRCRSELATSNPSTKKYADLKMRSKRYESEKLPEAIPQNAPDFIREFNLSSNDHLAYLIYDRLGIRDRTKEIVKDKKKERAVSSDVLQKYFEEEPALAPLAEYATYSKLLGTYIDKIPESLDVDGRLHTQLRTVSTGRYGSSGYKGKPNHLKPAHIGDDNYLATMEALVACDVGVKKGTNLQNIPSRSEEGTRVRMTFEPAPGYTYLGSDLSSIEPRIQAHRMASEFNDHSFAEMYRKGLDPYVEFAAILFGVDRELCEESAYKGGLATVPYRKLMKDMFLAEGYGQAVEQFAKTAVKRGVSEEAAKVAYAKFDEVLPGFKGMVESTFEHLRKYGWVATLWGQKRRFPEYVAQWKRLCTLMSKAGIKDKNDPELGRKSRRLKFEERTEFWQLIRATGRAERQAFNHTIQGSGANVLQIIMILAYYVCVLARGWEFNLTLHDELKFSVPNEQMTPEAVSLLDGLMTGAVELLTPLACDTVIEPCWMREIKPSEWFDSEEGDG